MRWFVVFCVACTGGAKDDTAAPVCDIDTLVLTDANNHAAVYSPTLEAVEVADAADVEFCWEGLTTDLRGRPASPGTMKRAFLAWYDGDRADLLAHFPDNSLGPGADLEFWSTLLEPGETCATVSRMEIIGNPLGVEHFTEARGGTWVAGVTADGWLGREEIRGALELRPRAVPTLHADIVPDSATLTAGADLSRAEPVPACAGSTQVDWSAVTVTEAGLPWDATQDTLVVLHSEAPLDEVEAGYVVATDTAETWSAPVWMETAAALYDDGSPGARFPVAADGRAFDGFTEDGTWFVGVACGNCPSPAPSLLAVVDVQPSR